VEPISVCFVNLWLYSAYNNKAKYKQEAKNKSQR
jgi:hypothetical protein